MLKRSELALMIGYVGVCSLILIGGVLFFMHEAWNTVSIEIHSNEITTPDLQASCLNLGVSSVPKKIPAGDLITLDRVNSLYPELIELTQGIKFTEVLTHTDRDQLCNALAMLETQNMRIE